MWPTNLSQDCECSYIAFRTKFSSVDRKQNYRITSCLYILTSLGRNLRVSLTASDWVFKTKKQTRAMIKQKGHQNSKMYWFALSVTSYNSLEPCISWLLVFSFWKAHLQLVCQTTKTQFHHHVLYKLSFIYSAMHSNFTAYPVHIKSSLPTLSYLGLYWLTAKVWEISLCAS